MKKTSTVIDYFVTSREISARCSKPQMQMAKQIAIHRPVFIDIAISNQHMEPRLSTAEKIPAQPRATIGPLNRPVDWDPTNKCR